MGSRGNVSGLPNHVDRFEGRQVDAAQRDDYSNYTDNLAKSLEKKLQTSRIQRHLTEKATSEHQKGTNDSGVEITPDELLKTGESAVILGEVGSGKTWLLEMIALNFAKAYQPDSKSKVPIRIRARQWKKDFSNLIEAIQKATEIAKLDQTESAIKADLQKGVFVLLIDGLDEVKTDLDSLCSEICNLSDQSAQLQILTTCRSGRYFDELGFKKWYIKPLTGRQIRGYLENKVGADAEAFHKTISQLINILKVPLLLLMTAEVLKNIKSYTTINISSLYILYIRKLLDSWPKEKSDSPRIPRIQKENILAQYAYALDTFGKRADENQLNAIICSELGEVNFKEAKQELIQSGIFGSSDEFEFFHPSFHEFFTALAISKKTDNKIFDFVRQFEHNPQYLEVLKFLVCLLPFPKHDTILKYFEENNLYLLNQCLKISGDEMSCISPKVEALDEFRDLSRYCESYLRVINTHFKLIKSIFKPWNALEDPFAEVQGVQISNFEAVLYGAIVGKTPIASMYYSWLPVQQNTESAQLFIRTDPKELRGMQEKDQLFYFEMCNVECSSPLWPHKKALNDIKKNLFEGLASQDFYMAEDHHLATEYLYHYFGDLKETVENLLKILDSYKRDNKFFFPEGDVDESFAKAYFYLLRFQQEGLNPLEFLLPQHDRDLADLAPGEPRNSWNLWTDKQVCLRVKHLYDAYQKSYRWMVEHAFPTLKDHLAFYRLGPVQFNIQVCIKRKALERFKGLLSGGSVSIEWKPVATMAEASTSVELIQEEQLEKESDIRATFSRLRTQLQAQGRNPDWISKGFWGRQFAIIDTVLEDNLLHKMVYEQLKK